jgi:hypothetical protein
MGISPSVGTKFIFVTIGSVEGPLLSMLILSSKEARNFSTVFTPCLELTGLLKFIVTAADSFTVLTFN